MSRGNSWSQVGRCALLVVLACGCGKTVQVGQPSGVQGIVSATGPVGTGTAKPPGSGLMTPLDPAGICGSDNVVQWTDFQPQGNLGSGTQQQQEQEQQKQDPSSAPCHPVPSPSPSPDSPEVTLTTSFPVPSGDAIDPTTIQVTVDGKPVGSEYDPGARSVTISPADSGSPGSIVTITACRAGWNS